MKTLQYIGPMALVVFSNTLYSVFTKNTPENLNPMASLTVTYLVAAAFSALLYFVLVPGGNILREYTKLNATPFLLGFSIVGLEVGWILAYRAGWQVSTGQIIQGSLLGIVLIFVGVLAYHEKLTWNKVAGVAVCMGGLVLINLK